MSDVPLAVRSSLSEDMSRSAAEAVRFLKVVAHERRLMILCHLCCGEKSVGELTGCVGTPQATTSQMLAVLREQGLVNSRRDGQKVFYSLVSGDARDLIGLLYKLNCGNQQSTADL